MSDPKPYLPTTAKPGSEDKVAILAARYAAGLELWNEEDNTSHAPIEDPSSSNSSEGDDEEEEGESVVPPQLRRGDAPSIEATEEQLSPQPPTGKGRGRGSKSGGRTAYGSNLVRPKKQEVAATLPEPQVSPINTVRQDVTGASGFIVPSSSSPLVGVPTTNDASGNLGTEYERTLQQAAKELSQGRHI